MKVRALHGVCIGVNQHLKAGDTADLDMATVTFLVSIKAVERIIEEPDPKPKESPEPSMRQALGKKEK